MHSIINPFIYNQILSSQLENPTIPPFLQESYSQAYEDVIIESILLAHLQNPMASPKSVTYIEIGANHPVSTSSTFLWQKKFGLKGILVEANPTLIDSLKKHRPYDYVVHGAVTDKKCDTIEFHLSKENEISSLDAKFVASWKNLGVDSSILVPAISVNSLLECVNMADLVLLIIDVEGMDFLILKDINWGKYRPFIIQVEPSDFYIPGSTVEMVKFLKGLGYMLIAKTYVNLVFVDFKRLDSSYDFTELRT